MCQEANRPIVDLNVHELEDDAEPYIVMKKHYLPYFLW